MSMAGRITAAVLVCVAVAAGRTGLGAAEGGQTVILDMDTAVHQPTPFGKDKTPTGTVEVVDGKVGKACAFTFAEGAQGGFFTARVAGGPEWDRSAGLSFWVKGDGSSSWGGLELIDAEDFALRYAFCFPIDSTEWRKITVRWADLTPELPKGRFVGAEGGYAPSGFRNLWFGKWWYWRDYPAHAFTVDQVALEREIPADATDYRPPRPGTPRLLAKLKARRPVTLVIMGDSLSDKRHWANREVLWHELLAAELRQAYGADVRVVNTALGGTELRQNLVLMPRWLKDTPEPDLVVVWFGYNDWSSGMRGEGFRETLAVAVDRLRRMTRGRSEVLLVTTCPAMERWDTMEELAQAARDAASAKRTGLADVAAAFHQRGTEPEARAALYCDDKAHLGKAGHTLAAQAVLKAIAEGATGPAGPR